MLTSQTAWSIYLDLSLAKCLHCRPRAGPDGAELDIKVRVHYVPALADIRQQTCTAEKLMQLYIIHLRFQIMPGSAWVVITCPKLSALDQSQRYLG